MTSQEIIDIIILGGLLGVLGQGIRMVVGLKKLSDENAKLAEGETSVVNITRLLTSIFIGFVAGALYLLINQLPKDPKPEFYFTIIAAGYAGTDFIEGLFNTYISKKAPGVVVTKTDTSTKETPPEKPKEPEQPKESISVENESIVQQKPLG